MSTKTIVLNPAGLRWGEMDLAMAATGMSRNWILELVEKGLVRKRKRNGSKQAQVTICITDLYEHLEDDEFWGR